MQEKIRPGYKQSEIGVIPEDWSVQSLGSVVDQKAPIRYGVVQIGPHVADGVPIVPIKYVKEIASAELHRSAKSIEEKYSNSRVRGSDVLISVKGTIGRVGVVPEGFEGNIAREIARIRLRNEFSPKFVASQLESDETQRRILEAVVGTTRLEFSIAAVRSFSIAVPASLKEQRAIAEALSDADARIAALESLIAKKRDLKQAAMQQLLTGKTRLPGFSGEWEVKPLGEIGEVSGAGVDKKVRESEQPVRLVNYMDAYRRTFIQSSDLDHWVTAQQHQARRCTVEKGDVFFTPSSETRDDIANSAVAMEDIPDAAYSYHVVRLRIKDHWDLKFRAYAFQTRDFLDQAQMICDGSGTRYVISLAKFRGMTVKVPEVKEQAAIAEILSDMDAELAALDAEAEKARTIKQGMMQNLLTGKVRLV